MWYTVATAFGLFFLSVIFATVTERQVRVRDRWLGFTITLFHLWAGLLMLAYGLEIG